MSEGINNNDKYGGWTVVREVERDNRGKARFMCRCDCGSEKVVRGDNLKKGGRCRSCARSVSGTTHGLCGHSLYQTWSGMRARCNTATHRLYKYYGGRGIKVCERWVDSFPSFLKDMGEKPSPKHSIDRIDNDGDYEPSNCRWATPSEQSLNQRVRSTSISGVTGVYRKGEKWVVYISVGGKRECLGSFLLLEDAIKVKQESAHRITPSIS